MLFCPDSTEKRVSAQDKRIVHMPHTPSATSSNVPSTAPLEDPLEKAHHTSIDFTITPGAWKQLAVLLSSEAPNSFFRIAIESGGCSGLQYIFTIDTVQQPDDQIFSMDNCLVVLVTGSLGFLSGAQLDYVKEMMGASFQITNPNAESNCGCGSSFSL